MKLLYLPAKYKGKIGLTDKQIKQLPPRLCLVASIQFIDSLEGLKSQLPGSVIGGQILGCRVEQAEKMDVDAFLFVGSGKFHPVGLYLKTHKPVYTYDPFSKTLAQLKQEDVDSFEKKRKAALSKYLSSKNIGILISLKTGQFYFEKAKKLIEIEKDPEKQFFMFAVDTVNLNELENFPFIDCWVNTACPRIADEKADICNADAIFKMYDLPADNIIF